MKIVIIHDDRRPEQERVQCEQEMKRQKIIQYAFWPAETKGETVAAAISTSHKQVVLIAKELGWPEVCIMESDVQFPGEDGWEYFLKNKPFVYDLYLAGVYCTKMSRMRELRPCLADSIIPITEVTGFHCYLIHEDYYDTFLNSPPDQHIDTAQRGGNYKVCYPFAAIQRPGAWSANHRSFQNYNGELQSQDVYGW